MRIDVERSASTPDGTPGRLSVDGVFLVYTLEPPDAGPHPDIPAGTYKVTVYPSPKFKRMVPQVVGVPGRAYIEIHPGNTDVDTEGCILLGTARQGTTLINSRAACELFQSKIALPLAKGETVSITLRNATPMRTS